MPKSIWMRCEPWPFRGHDDDYLGLRRALGHKLAHHEDHLRSYLAHVATVGDTAITVKNAIEWASLPPQALATWRSRRLMVVAGYAAYVHCRQESLAQLVPAGLIPASVVRGVPYIYTPEQTLALMNAASRVRTPNKGGNGHDSYRADGRNRDADR